MTGQSGSIGQYFPPQWVPLRSRLESAVSARIDEIKQLANGPFVLVHLAAMTSVKGCEQNPELAFAQNVEGSIRWMQAAFEFGCQHFVYVSTSHVFAPRLEPLPCQIEDATDARSVYGQSKAEAERRLQDLARKKDRRLTIARVFSVISPNMRPGYLYPELVSRAQTRDLSPLLGHKNVRDFIEAEQVAIQLEQTAIDETNQRPIRHICSGEARTVRSLAEEVFMQHGYRLEELSSLFLPTDERPNYLFSERMSS